MIKKGSSEPSEIDKTHEYKNPFRTKVQFLAKQQSNVF